ncbi:protein kinase domain-containing protein [Nocardia sp. NPDC003482]
MSEELAPGGVFAGFVVRRRLGRGGMGTVYLAEHPRLPKLTALKVLSRSLFDEAGVRARFEREAELAARLDHPNIVSIHDRGVEDGQPWISMQYIEGTDAASVGRVAPERALHIVRETARALDYAHARDVVHRDVKPANILLSPGGPTEPERIVLTDFGIARALAESTRLTRTGEVLATFEFASPEQFDTDADIDGRSDQYSLACTLFRLLTGRTPFPARDPLTMLHAHLFQTPPSLGTTDRALVPLDPVLTRALAKSPDQRFGTCREFADAAWRALSGSAGPQAVPPRPQPPGAPGTHRPPAAPLPPSRPAGPPDNRTGQFPAAPVPPRERRPPGTPPPGMTRTGAPPQGAMTGPPFGATDRPPTGATGRPPHGAPGTPPLGPTGGPLPATRPPSGPVPAMTGGAGTPGGQGFSGGVPAGVFHSSGRGPRSGVVADQRRHVIIWSVVAGVLTVSFVAAGFSVVWNARHANPVGAAATSTTVAPKPVPQAFIGNWSGSIAQPFGQISESTVTLHIPGDRLEGTFENSTLGCRGTMTLTPPVNGSVTATETPTDNPDGRCVAGSLDLTPAGEGRLRIDWREIGNPANFASGELTRQ